MTYFRQAFLNDIRKHLVRNTKMDLGDFEIETKYHIESARLADAMQETINGKSSRRTGGRLTIRCSLDNEFYFEAKIYSKVCDLRMNPGNSYLQSIQLNNIENDEILIEINEWARQVHRELVTPAVLREIEDVYIDLDKLRSRLDSIPDPDELFSKTEGEDMAQRLENLESKFKSYFEKSTIEAEEKERRITQLEEDMSFLKDTLITLTKKKWYTGLTTRLARWLGTEEGQAVLKSGTTIAKQLLLPDGQPPKSS